MPKTRGIIITMLVDRRFCFLGHIVLIVIVKKKTTIEPSCFFFFLEINKEPPAIEMLVTINLIMSL